MNQTESNEKILEIISKKNILLKEEIQLFKKLMFQCNLKIQNMDSWGWTPLLYAFIYNKDKNLNLSEEKWDYLIKNSDLNQQDKYGYTPLMYAFMYNKSENLNLSEEQWDYLIKNSDLKQQNHGGYTPLMYTLFFNKEQNLNLSEEQWDYLIKNSHLKQQNKDGWTHLFLALIKNKAQDLKLKKQHFQEMYEILTEKQQQKTFQNLIQKNIENHHQYEEEINILLYDCQFNPDEKKLSWLKKNHQDILERIEKRDLFFQLNQDVKEMNHQKYNKI